MFDARIRSYIDEPLSKLARLITPAGFSATQVTVAGFFLGMMAIPLLAYQLYYPALALILINRFLDGLDGALARIKGPTDLGAYLDIVLDFIFYSGVIFGFILGRPDDSLYGAFLIFSFIGTGSSFLAYATMAAKRGITTAIRGKKSFYYLGGLTEGTETIVTFILICIFPGQFPVIAVAFGVLCWLTTVSRIWWAKTTL